MFDTHAAALQSEHTHKARLRFWTMAERTKRSKVWLYFTRVDVDSARLVATSVTSRTEKLKTPVVIVAILG